MHARSPALAHPPHPRALDLWLARGAIVVIAALQLVLVNDLAPGPRWLAPAVEIALLLPLSAATVWVQGRARRAIAEDHHEAVARHHALVRRAAMVLTALVTAMNAAALIALVRALLAGQAGNAPTLLLDALNVWATNVIIFALWYWSLDRGGARRPDGTTTGQADFLFPQMTLARRGDPPFRPGFVDYLYLAFTNATAFSPADTLPLTARAKLLMMAEASVSFLTIAVVAARAVGILS